MYYLKVKILQTILQKLWLMMEKKLVKQKILTNLREKFGVLRHDLQGSKVE